jgi:acetyl-CoA acetyltransferase
MTTARNVAAIVGIGATAQGEHPGRSADDLAVEGAVLALADSGLDKSQIDGLITCKSNAGGIDTVIGAALGINPSYSATLDYGSTNFSLHLAVMAIQAGLARHVLLCYGTNQRTARRVFNDVSSNADLTAPYGFVHMGGPAALAARRHQHLYGTTEEALGQIAVAQRAWAQLNPAAVFREALTTDDYLAQPYIIRPLRRADLTLISDGGAGIVVSAATDEVADTGRAAFIRGMGQFASLREMQNPDALMRPHLAQVATEVYRRAGLGPEDVDVLYLQDPTSVWVLQMLEWYGFCPVGEVGRFLLDGHTQPGGRLPLNTNGGQLSESYMWGWLHLVELVRQLRGDAGPRQVSGAEVGMICSTMAFQKAAATVVSTVRAS